VAAAWEDVPNYAKTTGTFWVTREHVYIPPPVVGPGTLSNRAWLAHPVPSASGSGSGSGSGA
jgi:hypothetical protein